MAEFVAPLPINARRPTTVMMSARPAPSPLTSVRIQSPTSGTSGASSSQMRWADITPGAQASISSAAYGSGAYKQPYTSGQILSGTIQSGTIQSGHLAPTMVFPPTPSPWASMRGPGSYQFGSIKQAPTLLPATEETINTARVISPGSACSVSPQRQVAYAAPVQHQQQVIMQPAMHPAMHMQQPVMQPMMQQVMQPTMMQVPGQQMVMMAHPGMPQMQYAPQMQVVQGGTAQVVHQVMPQSGAEGQQQQQPAVMVNGQYPSTGSQLHGTGKCSPCAWFWKKSGCQNANNCAYCHMCPEGELKNRKKAKVQAIRMGVLQPAPANGSAVGAPPATLMLSSLVDS